MTSPATWNGKAEKDLKVYRLTALVVSHCFINMLTIAQVLGSAAFDFGICTFAANAVLTIFFLTTYLDRVRHSTLNELMLLEALGVNFFFTLGAGYLINRGVWLLVVRAF